MTKQPAFFEITIKKAGCAFLGNGFAFGEGENRVGENRVEGGFGVLVSNGLSFLI